MVMTVNVGVQLAACRLQQLTGSVPIGETAHLPGLEHVFRISQAVEHPVQTSGVGSEELKTSWRTRPRRHLLRHDRRV
jgi:hypothetical protein